MQTAYPNGLRVRRPMSGGRGVSGAWVSLTASDASASLNVADGRITAAALSASGR